MELLYLSCNDFSGEIPAEISSLRLLLRLDISDNNIRGPIPTQLAKLTHLLTLRLQNNALSGHVPDLSASLLNLTVLNVTNNELRGHVPDSMLTKFGNVSFSGNHALSPSSLSGSVVGSETAKRKSGSSSGSEKKVYGNGGNLDRDSDGTNTETERSKLVFFDRRNQFELEDLLRASAEMLGKGSLGTVYRAVLDDGCTVAVKRLKDANPCERNEFEQYMDVVGKLKHPNIVRLRAYYYAKEEKLLVYDYLPNGSLHALLHGNRGPGRIPLDWTTRISLMLGAARGLARIHAEYNASKIPHGNVKSSNVLLDKNGVALISDFGLSLLLNPVHAIARLGGYRAPEQVEVKRLSQEADVYGFGVLLLEVLTGRAPSKEYTSPAREAEVDLPKWVKSVVKEEWTSEVFDQELLRYKNIEDELVAMLHVGLACVAAQAEKRPCMLEVVKMIEEIRVEESPLGDDYDEAALRFRLPLPPPKTTSLDYCLMHACHF
ncbi:Putative inactive receptor kinase [Glycine soja]|nr:Putative inactive receptor kinase [Glycine soja]